MSTHHYLKSHFLDLNRRVPDDLFSVHRFGMPLLKIRALILNAFPPFLENDFLREIPRPMPQCWDLLSLVSGAVVESIYIPMITCDSFPILLQQTMDTTFIIYIQFRILERYSC